MDAKEVNMNDVKKTGEMDREKEPQREKWSRKIDFLLACVGEYLVGVVGCESGRGWDVLLNVERERVLIFFYPFPFFIRILFVITSSKS